MVLLVVFLLGSFSFLCAQERDDKLQENDAVVLNDRNDQTTNTVKPDNGADISAADIELETDLSDDVSEASDAQKKSYADNPEPAEVPLVKNQQDEVLANVQADGGQVKTKEFGVGNDLQHVSSPLVKKEVVAVSDTQDRYKPAGGTRGAGAHNVLDFRSGPDDFNEQNKRKTVESLVQKATVYMQRHSLEHACNKFTHTKDFMQGELYIFLIDYSGVVYAHGQDSELLWQNLYELKDRFGTYIMQELIKKAQMGGGWITYEWKNATKTTYVKPVVKNGKSFAIACGYYAHSKEEAVKNLVNGAANFFQQIMNEGLMPEDAFSNLSYPLGKFVFGDLYLYALDFKGNHVAHGDRPGLIGTNGLNYKDSNGKYVNQEIINELAQKNEIWVEYTSKRALKKAYARKVTDKDGNHYFIACGYYPEIAREQVTELVKRGYQYMKMHGRGRAADEFSDKRNVDFRYGDLYLIVYDKKGNVVAHGGNPDLIGQNMYNMQDDDGRYYIREIIKKADTGNSTWLNIKNKNAYMALYFEKIDLGNERYFIGSGLYPVSKKESMILAVKSAIDFFKASDSKVALNEFVRKNGRFLRGDLSIYVFDNAGICYIYGDDKNLVWRNLMSVTDDEGKAFIRNLIESGIRGATLIKNLMNHALKISYVEPVEKDGKIYIIGSSFYQ